MFFDCFHFFSAKIAAEKNSEADYVKNELFVQATNKLEPWENLSNLQGLKDEKNRGLSQIRERGQKGACAQRSLCTAPRAFSFPH